MKLSDYVAEFLASHGVECVFGMSGGAAVHLFDSIERRSEMRLLPMTHEQCAAMAADGYARASGRLGVAISTSGPGATNLLTGICCSFYDSIPVMAITGQVATHRLKGDRPVRQVGFQETDVVSIFSAVTKYAIQVRDPLSIRYHLEKAYHIAMEGRPGPVLLDIPDDVQRMEICPGELVGFEAPSSVGSVTGEQIREVLNELARASRPVLILGGGLKTPDLGGRLIDLLEKLGVPCLLSWAAIDLLPSGHTLRVGPFGVYGPRAGNFVVQNADLVLALGTRLSQNLTGGVLSSFAREARILMVDVDRGEMDKFDGKGLEVHGRIHSSLSEFVDQSLALVDQIKFSDIRQWRERIAHWQGCFAPDPSPVANPGARTLDATEFVRALSLAVPERTNVFVDTGGNLAWTCNNFAIKAGQRLYSAWNNTPMGYSLPAAIGAALRCDRTVTTCIIGDGGLMICLAELATLFCHALPVKVFLLNNESHGIQKQTLETWLGGRYVGVDVKSGLSFPRDYASLAHGLGIAYVRINVDTVLSETLAEVYKDASPCLVDVRINPDQKLYPFLKFGQPLENQTPFLDSGRVEAEMLVPAYRENQANPVARKQGGQGW